MDLYGHLVPEASGRARDALDRAFGEARMCPGSAPAASVVPRTTTREIHRYKAYANKAGSTR